MASTETAKILQEEPYVKVATREIAILVQEVQNSQKEKRDLKERCSNLENYISSMRPTNRPGNERRVYSDETATATRAAFFPPTFSFKPYSRPEAKLIEATVAKSSNQLENDLEEDTVSLAEVHVFVEPDCKWLRERQRDTTQSDMVFQYPQIHETLSSDSDFMQPTILSKYPEQTTTKNKFYGVSEDSFNMALKELAKCKKSNAELKKMTENAPKNRSECHNLVEKVQQVEVENAALHNKIKGLERNVTDEAHTDIINTLQKKIFQQERHSSLRNLAFDQLNNQCDKWRRKYEEMSNQFGQLSKQIYRKHYEVVRDAPLFRDELLEISSSTSTPNFDRLLRIQESLETDVVMHDQVEEDPNNRNKSEMSERVTEKNSSVNMFVKDVNMNISDQNKQDVVALDNVSDVNLNNVPENQATSCTTTSTVHVFLSNLNARNDVSTQIDSRVFGKNKYVQTDANNNVIDEETQTEQTTVTSDVNDNNEGDNLTKQSDRYECMREENTVMRSSDLTDKDNSRVAEELANRMKQLNLQLFSVYKDKDCLKNMIQSQYEDFRRESPEREVYSMPSASSETRPRHTIKLSSKQITVLSDLSTDSNNLNNTSGREYRSCPDLW